MLKDTVKEILEGYVEEGYNLDDVISDLNHGGCQPGFITELIYYKDTEKFFKDHQEEIESLMDELGITMDSLSPDGASLTQYMNNAAWCAFEMVAQEYAQ